MRILSKLAMKFATLVIMVLLMGSGLKHGQRYIMQAAGMPVIEVGDKPKFSSDEADLMSTVFKSALRLFSGSASREELAGELSDKLYSGRAGAGDMAELGIELVKPGGGSSAPEGAAGVGNGQVAPLVGEKLPPTPPCTKPAGSAKSPAKQGAAAAIGQPAKGPVNQRQAAYLTRIWDQVKPYSVELGLIPVVLLGMILVGRIRQRRSRADDFAPPMVATSLPAESEPYDMKHAVHALGAEDFEMLVALIYQRQGYRVSMSAALSGGRGGDFMLARKAEQVLVQCKKLSQEHRVPVERVRELHEAMTAAGVTRGLYVASCGFTWDARNFAKTRGVTLINARTLDELLTVAREQPDEDLLAVSSWVPKLMSKVKLTPPLCPTCEATMDELKVSHGTVWVCSQRPDCRGRRSARKYHKPVATAARNPDPVAAQTAEPEADRKPAVAPASCVLTRP